MKVRFLKAARLELRLAFESYRSIRRELGEDFLNKVQNGVDYIRDHPLAWQQGSRGSRRYILNRFPYAIVYKVYDDGIVIIAVAHLSREPDYWQDRVDR